MDDTAPSSALELILQALPDGVLIVDAVGSVRFANPAAGALLERTLRDLTAHPFDLPLPSAARIEWEIGQGATVRTIEATTASIVWDDCQCRLIALRDVSAAKHAATDIQLQAQHLAQARQRSAVATLVAAMGHEINNPNSMISLNAEFVDEIWSAIRPLIEALDPSDGSQRRIANMSLDEALTAVSESLRDIGKGSRRIRAIVNELLEFSRPDDGNRRSLIDLRDTVDRTIRLLTPRLSRSAAKLEVHADAELPAIWADALQMEQILFNLLDNAIDAVAVDGGTIKLRLAAARGDGGVDLQVEDDGCGMAPAVREQVLATFVSTRREHSGGGLGLRSTKRLIDGHQGSLEILARQPRGTVVNIHLPGGDPADGRTARGAGS
jgi:signal transduction histidine kinase